MSTVESRISKLEERVFGGQANDIKELKDDLKDLNKRLNWLIVVLAGNFGLTFVKILGGMP